METDHAPLPAHVLEALESSQQDLAAGRVVDARPVQERLRARLEDARQGYQPNRMGLR